MNNRQLLEIDKLSKKYNENRIPLYVSYPTTSWWKDEIVEKDYINVSRDYPVNFLYVHFPYCKTSCYYCCCYREIAKSTCDNDIYLFYLKKEIDYKVTHIGVDAFKKINNIHWGGGTPTYLTNKQIEEAFNYIKEKINYKFTGESHISIEAYPDKNIITMDKLKCLKKLGFTHISFGVQDFNEIIQRTINRYCTESDVEEIILNAKNIGLKVNIDLCYGLPFQGINEVLNTVNKVIKFEPERVSLFPYVHFPLIFPLQRLIPDSSIPNSFIMSLMLKKAVETFENNGYKRIGYDHFVKNNMMKKDTIRDFMGQSEMNNRNFIGIGSSAISFIDNLFFHNVLTVKDYYKFIDEEKLPLIYNKACNLDKDDFIRNKLILKSILTDFCIYKNKFNEEFEIEFEIYFKDELNKLLKYEEDGLIKGVKSNKIYLTRYGKIFARHISYVFDKYYT